MPYKIALSKKYKQNYKKANAKDRILIDEVDILELYLASLGNHNNIF